MQERVLVTVMAEWPTPTRQRKACRTPGPDNRPVRSWITPEM